MLAKNVVVSQFKSWEECEDVIESIENDSRNSMGTSLEWSSGEKTRLTAVARLKIQSLNRKVDRLLNEDN